MKVVLSWSGGKDSAVALYELQTDSAWQVDGLLTTIDQEDGRVGAHDTRHELVVHQAKALPLHTVKLPRAPDNVAYEAAMATAFSGRTRTRLRQGGLRRSVPGRSPRLARRARHAMSTLHPAWGRDTRGLAERLLTDGFRATVCCVDLDRLGAEFVGWEVDASFLADLPSGVDFCGEAGEFHTSVHDAPHFRRPVPTILGDRTIRGDFTSCDLLPGSTKD